MEELIGRVPPGNTLVDITVRDGGCHRDVVQGVANPLVDSEVGPPDGHENRDVEVHMDR